MTKTAHALYILLLVATGTAIIGGAAVYGGDYYLTPLKERPFHTQYDLLKPTGLVGHGYGIVGTLMILLGVGIYSGRKRIRALSTFGKMKHFLEFHIFLCTTGPALILFHTTFKFGGLVAISFWSMVAVFLSGIVGRYLYVQIPKGIQGDELSLEELNARRRSMEQRLIAEFGVSPEFIRHIDRLGAPSKPATQLTPLEVFFFLLFSDMTRGRRLRQMAAGVKKDGLSHAALKHFLRLANDRLVISRRIALLEKLRGVFHLWHVVHLPFSMIMVLILFIHVGVAIAFGYRWIW